MNRLAAYVRRTSVAAIASLAVLFASAAPLVAGHLGVDRECAPSLATEHDHAAHRLQKLPQQAADHCAACHVARVVSDPAAAPASLHAGLAPGAAAEPGDARAPRRHRAPDLTRGPPLQF